MPVDRPQWKERFDALPHWRCPTCGKGHLLPIPDKIWFEETGESKAEHDHDAWGPDWILNRFAGFLRCNLPQCGEVASISGTSPSDFFEYQDEHEHIQSLENRFVVRSIDPAPIPITFPDVTPEAIGEAISRASRILWSSGEAAGNQLRQAVELFLDDVGVPSQSEKGAALTTHKRIGIFATKDKENGEVLLATKWLGNSGSHPGGLSRDDVLDAFDMLEYVLGNYYSTAKKELLAKVAAVNAQKGPIKK